MEFTIYCHPKFVAAAKTLAVDITAKGYATKIVDFIPSAMEPCQAQSNRRVLLVGAYESESNTVTERRGCAMPLIQPRGEFLASLTD